MQPWYHVPEINRLSYALQIKHIVTACWTLPKNSNSLIVHIIGKSIYRLWHWLRNPSICLFFRQLIHFTRLLKLTARPDRRLSGAIKRRMLRFENRSRGRDNHWQVTGHSDAVIFQTKSQTHWDLNYCVFIGSDKLRWKKDLRYCVLNSDNSGTLDVAFRADLHTDIETSLVVGRRTAEVLQSEYRFGLKLFALHHLLTSRHPGAVLVVPFSGAPRYRLQGYPDFLGLSTFVTLCFKSTGDACHHRPQL